MGLFPEIGRAWLTIDSDIYIWTYEQTRDVAYYDGLSHLIVSVGLIKSKPGVLVDDVKYLLLLTTPIEVIALGVTFGESNDPRLGDGVPCFNKGMQLLNKPIFVLGTDNVSFNVIQGTDDGRIFMGGRDGCLYEIDYHSESSWFGKRCKKINHSQGLVSYIVPSFLKVFSVSPHQRFFQYFYSKNNNFAFHRTWILSRISSLTIIVSCYIHSLKRVLSKHGTLARI